MAILYQVLECANPGGTSTVEYACCRVKTREPKTIVELAEAIMGATTYTKADVVGVLTAFKEYAKTHLLDGQSLRFGDIGILSPRIMSRCFPQSAISADGFDPSNYITGIDVKMRVSEDIKSHIFVNRKLERVPSDLMAATLRESREKMRAKLEAAEKEAKKVEARKRKPRVDDDDCEKDE